MNKDEKEFLKSGNLPENWEDKYEDLDIIHKTPLYEILMMMIRAGIFTLEKVNVLISKFKLYNSATGKTIKEFDRNNFNWIEAKINTTSISTNNLEEMLRIKQPVEPRDLLSHLEIQEEYEIDQAEI